MAVGHINVVAALTGFSYKKMCGRFAGTEKSIGNNEVTIRWGSTVCKISSLNFIFRGNHVSVSLCSHLGRIRSVNGPGDQIHGY